MFCGLFLVFVFFESAVRPYNVNVLLDQQDGDTRSASALINFTRVFIGAIGMFMVMLPFPDYIVAVGGLMTAGIAIALVGWYALLRSKLILRGVKDDEEPESLL